MVDALKRARLLLAPGGVIADLHPTPEPAHLELFDGRTLTRLADRIDDGTANGPKRRHASASAAVARCVDEGLLRLEAAAEFPFWTQTDTTAELREYLGVKWKQLHFDDAAFLHADAALARTAGSTIVVTERVIASMLTVRASGGTL